MAESTSEHGKFHDLTMKVKSQTRSNRLSWLERRLNQGRISYETEDICKHYRNVLLDYIAETIKNAYKPYHDLYYCRLAARIKDNYGNTGRLLTVFTFDNTKKAPHPFDYCYDYETDWLMVEGDDVPYISVREICEIDIVSCEIMLYRPEKPEKLEKTPAD